MQAQLTVPRVQHLDGRPGQAATAAGGAEGGAQGRASERGARRWRRALQRTPQPGEGVPQFAVGHSRPRYFPGRGRSQWQGPRRPDSATPGER